MENNIQTGSPFLSCRNGAGNVGETLYLRPHRKYEVEKDLWFSHGTDFNGEAWILETEVEVEDGTKHGSGRTGDKAVSFKQTLTVELNNDYSSPFLQTLYDITMHGDEYLMDFFKDGLDAKIVQVFPNGAYTQKEFYCGTVTTPPALFDQLNNSDASSELVATLNNEPIVRSVGFSGQLPKEYATPQATIKVTVEAKDITVAITDVKDTDNVVIENQWVATLINKETSEVVMTTTSEEDLIAMTVKESGDYIVAIGYVYMVDDKSGTSYSNYVKVEEVKVV